MTALNINSLIIGNFSLMLAKAGFILAVLAFGALMFIAGAMAPASLQSSISNKTSELLAQLPLDKPADIVSKITAAKAKDTDKDKAETKKNPKSKDKKPIEYSLLNLPAVLPPKGSYALELAMTVNPSSATEWLNSLKEQRYAAHKIAVIGPDGGVWSVIAAGTYHTPKEAQAQRLNLRQDVPKTSSSSLRVILLPPPPPAKPASKT